VSVERELAAWVAGLSSDDLPPATAATVENVLADAVASALAGRSQRLLGRVDTPARTFAGAGRATVIGATTAAPAAAAFLNAYAVTAATVCDVYRPGLCHVTPVTLPPLLTLAELYESTGRRLLESFAIGLEVTARLSQALAYPELRRRGWHSPGVVGPVGAAAAGAHLLGLDEDGVASALAHAAAQSAGTFAGLGTEAVKFNQARAAVSALLATFVAESGLAAAEEWLTAAEGGLAAAYTEGADPPALTRELGSEWRLHEISLRRWPAASSVQSLIELCLELACERRVAPADVESIEIELAPAAYQVSGDRGWADSLAAMQSARWVTAVVLADRDWWIEQSAPERIGDPEVGAFARERVSVTAVAEVPAAGVRLRVALADGSRVGLDSADAPGDPDRPLGRKQIEDKLRRAILHADVTASADELLELLHDLPTADSAVPLVRALGAPETA
jgi:2-methylcitrate dehydratase PrpD